VSLSALEKLKVRFGASVLETHSQFGDDTAVVEARAWLEICAFCKEQLDCAMLTDLTAVDYPEREPRFEVVAHLYSLNSRERVRLKARVGASDLEATETTEIASVAGLWQAANWLERECFDMFGIRFTGHPDLRRILMYPEFEGHPLRKDYSATKTQPLIEFRTEAEAGLPLDKQAPFGPDEGMSFGRRAPTVRGELS
jgi:NADH-quinone oxidoreductase subunit C